MSIKIPKQLNDCLKREEIWSARVSQLKARVELFLSGSPEFFPDYTVHSAEHINEVLESAEKLIPQEAFATDVDKNPESGILEPMDAAYLVCAIMIHDLGMFLHRDGVKKLLSYNRNANRIKDLDSISWKEAWTKYIDKTKRYSSEKMLYHFGRNIPVREDCVEKEALDDDDKRIIGEFLRQNHGRLAHEIALFGLPGSENVDLFENSGFSEEDRDMIGLLARSHTMNIRDTESYLKSTFEEGPMPLNTPVFYLMSVLRIADYLDAGEHRAPKLLEANQKIYVPISVQEWDWNQCIIKSRCQWRLKNKSRYIYAEPKTSIEYVLLDKWHKSVQAELDLCWSILAEHYPNGYRLSIHRITNRIYQHEYRKTMNKSFLTEEVKLSANPEIARLMIDPLYGSDPSYGIRELLQNAVDACVERKPKEKDSDKYHGLVTVRIDPWSDPDTGEELGVFTIEDNGIGMNAHVLMNYYLSAGASYRSSEEWKRDYTVDNKAQIARTGQFGVGFLASFLLGNTVTVHTQHIKDETGYSFSFTDQAKPLNIIREKRAEGPGTTIRIVLNPGVLEKLREGTKYPWQNWYAFDEPEVKYFFFGKPVEHEGISLFRDPSKNTDWFTLPSEDFDAYLWNPVVKPDASVFFDNSRRRFYCNGIRVYHTQTEMTLEDDGLSVHFPHVSIKDRNTKLDINLARSEIRTFPERESLLRQVFRYHVARLLMTQWSTEEDYRNNLVLGFHLWVDTLHGRAPFLLTPDAFALNCASVLSAMDIEQFVIVYYDAEDPRFATEEIYRNLPKNVPVCVAIADSCPPDPVYDALDLRDGLHFGSPEEFVSILLSSHSSILGYRKGLWNPNAVNYNLNHHLVQIRITEEIRSTLSLEASRNASKALHSSKKPILDMLDPNTFPFSAQVVLQKFDYNLMQSGKSDLLFPRILRELLGPNEAHPNRDLWIPRDMEARKAKFPEAFQELQPYFDYIRRNR